ncbi:MAG: hypothetical protein GW917_02120, partial [Bdellovibrionales bacterium]|nr:hypothetical protein [Bdellovibrionales bacterium]
DYVNASKSLGASNFHLGFKCVAPNC